ncbi:isocitrate lyase/phosphoenolpyruvate mutase family protein [Streptomyces sp. NPDC001982]|uniref:isocitrate lyase/phosphoenolpyruvate mutase family protein n=1 Tax=Streptomyces sp. NPDC001982 TaxID=3154405 RepID=UPI00331FB693
MRNTWDGPSALLFREAGFKSIATSSAALASGLGRIDGTHAVSRDEHLDHAALLTSVSGLPVNGDFEDGYGKTSRRCPGYCRRCDCPRAGRHRCRGHHR